MKFSNRLIIIVFLCLLGMQSAMASFLLPNSSYVMHVKTGSSCWRATSIPSYCDPLLVNFSDNGDVINLGGTDYGSPIAGDGWAGVIVFTTDAAGENFTVNSFSQDATPGTAMGRIFFFSDTPEQMTGSITAAGDMTFIPASRMAIGEMFAETISVQRWNFDNSSKTASPSNDWEPLTTGISTNQYDFGFNHAAYSVTGSPLAADGSGGWNARLVTAGNMGEDWGLFSGIQYEEIWDVHIQAYSQPDSDSDGVDNGVDAFPNNNAASVDADNDGLPDAWNAGCDVTCQNGSGLILDTSLDDTDNDGVVNGSDAFPTDPNETTDTDSDGVGDNADAFPGNNAASVDVDNDGLPDEWNAGCDITCQNNSGLTLDTSEFLLPNTSYVMHIKTGSSCFLFGDCNGGALGLLTDNSDVLSLNGTDYGSSIAGDGWAGVIVFTTDATGENFTVSSFSQDAAPGTAMGTIVFFSDTPGLMTGSITAGGGMTFIPASRMALGQFFTDTIGVQPWSFDNSSMVAAPTNTWEPLTTGTSTNEEPSTGAVLHSLTGSPLVFDGVITPEGDLVYASWNARLVMAGNMGVDWLIFNGTPYTEIWDVHIEAYVASGADGDGDGVDDGADAFPNNNAASVDVDSDGLPDAWNVGCDATCQSGSGLILDTSLDDTDNDGVANGSDAFPTDPSETTDTDSDGVGNNLDINDDNDSYDDVVDNCTLTSNDQLDTDGDGYGNACDADFNGDNIVNSFDIGLFRTMFFNTGVQDADMNGDSIVNSLDLGMFKKDFMGSPGPSGLNP